MANPLVQNYGSFLYKLAPIKMQELSAISKIFVGSV
jgi:hypothetical protein